MFAITVALITAAAIGLHFNATRSLGIAAVVALAFIYPVVITAIFIFAVLAIYLFKVRKP